MRSFDIPDPSDPTEKDKVVINKDISIERIPCVLEHSPLNYNIVTTDGKVTIERNNIVRYLKDCRIIYIGDIPFIFDGCTYKKTDPVYIARMIYNAVDMYDVKPFVSKSMVSDIIAKLQATCLPEDIPIPPEWDEEGLYENYSELIPFDNGIYNFVHDRFLRFSPYVFLTHQL